MPCTPFRSGAVPGRVVFPGPVSYSDGMNRTTAKRIAAAAMAVAALATSSCMDDSPARQRPFAERSAEPTGVPMPDRHVGEALAPPGPRRESRPTDDPCATGDSILAACLGETTALAPAGPGRAVVATADGHIHLVTAGSPPADIADMGGRVLQITASPTVAEDGQLYVLLAGGGLSRLTLLPGGGTDVRDLPEHSDPETLGFYLDADGEPFALLSGDPGIELISVCHAPPGLPPLLTVRLDGTPMLAQWSGSLVEPLGGVDLDDTLGGCAFTGTDVIVAVPGAQRVVSIPATPPAPGPFGAWTINGSPTTLVEGEFGHVGWVAPVLSDAGVEMWGATVNKADGREGGDADERVFRLPSGGSAAGSPA